LPLPLASPPCVMMHRFLRRQALSAVFLAACFMASRAYAHVVPDITVEADFNATGGYTLRINVDPRIFLAAEPRSLPPVPGSWYHEQTPEQVAATHASAQQYLAHALGVLFNAQKITLPPCQFQAIDGADNTPLKSDTQEIHLLATVTGQLPADATTFQIDFAKDANSSLILLPKLAGNAGPRPQVVFPGETSRPFQLKVVAATTQSETPVPSNTNQVYLIIAISLACIVGITGWLLLSHYRHHHRAHRKPGAGKM
jgi:hypothetical protein